MRLLLIAALVAVFSFQAYAGSKSATIDATTDLVTLIELESGARNGQPGLYEAMINCYGTFNSGTLHFLQSTDGGTTKSAIQYASSTASGAAARTATAADNFTVTSGWPSQGDSIILYASVAGASSAPSVTCDVFDNL